MAYFDFGARKGFAYVHDTQRTIQNMRYRDEVARRNKLDAENKAKILGDKLKFGKASNPWDHKLLQEFNRDQILGIGKFVAENPDWQSNPFAWANFSRMTNELVDNDIIWRDKRIMAEKERMDKWEADPANRHRLDEIANQKKALEDYYKTGSMDGIAENKVEFKFGAPDEQYDMEKYFAEQAQTVWQHKRSAGSGVGGYKLEVDPVDMMKKAISMAKDKGPYGRQAMADYKKGLASGSIQEGTSYQQWLYNRLWPNRRKSEEKIGHFGKSSSGDGFGGLAAGQRPYANWMLDPNYRGYRSSIRKVMGVGKNGEYNTGEQGLFLEIIDKNGKAQMVPIPGSANQTFMNVNDIWMSKRMGPEEGHIYQGIRMDIPWVEENQHIIDWLGGQGYLKSTEWLQEWGDNFDELEDVLINKNQTVVQWNKPPSQADSKEDLSFRVKLYANYTWDPADESIFDDDFMTKAGKSHYRPYEALGQPLTQKSIDALAAFQEEKGRPPTQAEGEQIIKKYH